MKTYILTVVFLFIFSLVPPSVIVPFKHVMAATASSTQSAVVKNVMTRIPTQTEYILPYPGILPTHPLYFLKKFRDYLIEMMITDPVKKVEFYILQADKRLNMGIFLFTQKNERRVATEQLIEAVLLREKAVIEVELLQSKAKDVPPYVIEKLLLSIQKHMEVDMGYKRGVEQLQVLLERTKILLSTENSEKVINTTELDR